MDDVGNSAAKTAEEPAGMRKAAYFVAARTKMSHLQRAASDRRRYREEVGQLFAGSGSPGRWPLAKPPPVGKHVLFLMVYLISSNHRVKNDIARRRHDATQIIAKLPEADQSR